MEDLFKQISQEKITQYQAHLEKLELSEATIKRRLSALRKFYNWAEKEGYLEKLPRKAPVIKETPSIKRLKYLTSKLRPTFPSMPTIPFISDAYEVYQSISITKYLHYAILIIFCVGLGIGIYNQLTGPKAELAEAYPDLPTTRPNRYLSFQGRLTDSSNNPISEPTDFVFKLYNDEGTGCPPSGGVQLWSGSCSIDPDEDGIFSVLLGLDCGSEIDDSVFSENADVWLEITVGTDPYDEILCPRIQVATVAYALNAETLQGYPPGTAESRIPYIDSTGKITIAAASPILQATSASAAFVIEGKTGLVLQTASASNANITIAPNGTGALNINLGGASGNQMQVTDASITSGALVSVYAGTSATGFDLLNLSSGTGTPGTTVFSVDESGNTYAAGNVGIGTTNPGAKLDVVGDIKIGTVNSVDDNNQVLTVDSGIVKYINTTNWDKNSGDDYGAWWLAGNSGTPQNIGAGDTASIVGGIGIGTTASATDTLTINVDQSYGFAWTGTHSYSATDLNFTNTTSFTLDVTGDLFLDADGGEILFGDAGSWFGGWSAGNLGIGTTNPKNKLDVSGSVAIGSLPTSALPQSNMLYVSGNVGIGTTNPLQKLQVAGDINIESGSGIRINNTATSGYYLRGDGTRFVSSAIQEGDLPSISAAGGWTDDGSVVRLTTVGDEVGIGTTSPGAKLEVVADGTGQIPLLVSGYSNSQTADLFQVRKYNGATPNFVIDSAGQVGIGTTGPGAALDVLKITEQLRLSYNASNYTSFTTNNSGDLTISASGDTLSFNVASNAFFKFREGADSLVEIWGENTGDSILYVTSYRSEIYQNFFGIDVDIKQTAAQDTYGLVGVRSYPQYQGTTGTQPDIYGLISIPTNVSTGAVTAMYGLYARTDSSSGAVSNAYGIYIDDPTGASSQISNLYGLKIDNLTEGTNKNWSIYSEGGTMYHAGNVGIGTSAPEQELTVDGDIQLGMSDGTRYVYFHDGGSPYAGIRYESGTNKMQFSHDGSSWSDMGTGGDGGYWTLSVNDLFPNLPSYNVGIGTTGSAGTAKLYVNGNVGIGTTGPDDKLDVVGEIDTSTYYKLGNSKILDVENTGTLLVGQNAGPSLVAGADYNTFVGQYAGYSTNNAGADKNVFLGAYAGYSNTSGFQNTFLGRNAGYTNQDGYYNTFVGTDAGWQNTSGWDNVFIGHSAGFNNTTGNDNTYIGNNAHGQSGTSYSIVLSNGAGAEATADHQLVVGGAYNDAQITDSYWGSGVTDITPYDFTFNATGGLGTNIAGANLKIAGGKATGNAAGGNITFLTSDAGASGTTLQSLSEKMRITAGGSVGIGTTSPNNLIQVANLINFDNTGYNTSLGYQAGKSLTTGAQYNTYLGYTAGYSNTTGDYGTFLGYEAGYSITSSGTNNILIGYRAGRGITNGNNNLIIGSDAGYTGTSGSNNTFIGHRAGFSHTAGGYNVFVGESAGYYDDYGYYNTFLGYEAGWRNTTGEYNTFVGNDAGNSNTIGDYNVAVGNSAGWRSQTGSGNVFIGDYAGYGSTANYTGADNNVIIGQTAGFSITNNSDKNVFIGYQAGYSETGSNKLYIENSNAGPTTALIYGDFNTDTLTFNANVGIGTTNPGSYKLNVAGTAAFNNAGVTIDSSSYVNAQRFVDIGSNYYLDPAHAVISGLFKGYVGIGTTNPSSQLHLTGNITMEDDKWIGSGPSGPRIDFDSSAGWIDTYDANVYISEGQIYISPANDDAIYIYADNWSSGDNLGINAYLIDSRSGAGGSTESVGGAMFDYRSDSLTSNHHPSGVFSRVYAANASNANSVIAYGFQTDIWVGGAAKAYGIYNYVASDGTGDIYGAYLYLDGSSATRWGLYVTGEQKNYFSGNVGIGTTGPNEQLEITGNFRLPETTSTTGIIKAGTTPFIHNYGSQNTFVGLNAGNLTTTGNDNSAFGEYALYAITEGWANTAIGAYALDDTNTGYQNTAVGSYALDYNTSGYDNTAIGYSALLSNVSGNYNTAVGSNALYDSTGNNNTAIGYEAGRRNTTGASNTFLGYYAGYYNQTGANNIFIGYEAGRGTAAYTGSDDNVMIGYQAGYWLSSNADSNTFLGYGAGYYNQTGISNVFLGRNAGRGTAAYTGSDWNVLIGYQAGNNISSNTNSNTIIGYQAGQNITTGGSNTALGFQAGHGNQTGISNVFIGYEAGQGTAAYTGSDSNTIIGYQAGASISSDTDSNTIIGYQAGQNITTGGYNIFLGREAGQGTAAYTGSDSNTIIGYRAGYSISSDQDYNVFLGNRAGYSEAGSNKLYIDNSDTGYPLIYGDFSTNALTINGTLAVTSWAANAATHVCRNGNTLSGCTSAAEYAPTFGDVEEGDLISISPNQGNPDVDPKRPFVAEKASKAYDPNLIGFILDPELGADGEKINEQYLPLGIYGYFPIKVSTINGSIERGDPITSSKIPGVGMKATKAGFTVGRALEPYDNSDPNVVGKIQVFVNLSWYDPDVFLTASGDLKLINENEDAIYSGLLVDSDNVSQIQNLKLKMQNYSAKFKIIKEETGEVVERIVTGADGVFARVKTGLIETQNLIAENIVIEKKLVSPLVETEQLTAKSIQATKSKFGKLISTQIETDQLQVNKDATIAGTLYADKVVAREIVGLQSKFGELIAATVSAEQIQGLEERLAQLEALKASPSPTPTPTPMPTTTPTPTPNLEPGIESEPPATGSGDPMEDVELSPDIEALVNEILNQSPVTSDQQPVNLDDEIPITDHRSLVTDLTVLGATSLADTSIAGSLNVDGTMSLSDNSINTLTGPLYLQNLGLGGIDILAGKVTIDKQGNAVFEGDVTIKGRLALSEIEPLPGQENIVIDLTPENEEEQLGAESRFGKLLVKGIDNQVVASIDASGSAQFAQVTTQKLIVASDQSPVTSNQSPSVETNATAGETILPAGKTEITIKSQFVTENTLVYVTPISSTQNKVLYVKVKKAKTDEEIGWFKVGIDTPIGQDIQFNWWIIN